MEVVTPVDEHLGKNDNDSVPKKRGSENLPNNSSVLLSG